MEIRTVQTSLRLRWCFDNLSLVCIPCHRIPATKYITRRTSHAFNLRRSIYPKITSASWKISFFTFSRSLHEEDRRKEGWEALLQDTPHLRKERYGSWSVPQFCKQSANNREVYLKKYWPNIAEQVLVMDLLEFKLGTVLPLFLF